MNIQRRISKLEDKIGDADIPVTYLFVNCLCRQFQAGTCQRIGARKREPRPEGIRAVYVFAPDASTSPQPCSDCPDGKKAG